MERSAEGRWHCGRAPRCPYANSPLHKPRDSGTFTVPENQGLGGTARDQALLLLAEVSVWG